MTTLDGKSALVTGGGSGIGRAIALALAREGAGVLVTDMNESAGLETCELIRGAGGSAHFAILNVAVRAEHEVAVQTALGLFGPLNIACNNAGISTGRSGTYHPMANISQDDWNDIVGVNLNGVFYGMQSQIAAMRKSGGGSIINMASIMGQVAGPGLAAYVATKHAVVGLTKAAAVDHASEGIRVNAVGPGYIETPILQSKSAAAKDQLSAMHPLGRLGKPEEVAELVAWLSSERSSFVTGAYYPVDGGFLAK